ncbi:MAG: DUF1501 domain-containing protein [Curvibacter sp.]|nr:MAG: DUF1501 domain-containing protein [Curvibacter sp.]
MTLTSSTMPPHSAHSPDRRDLLRLGALITSGAWGATSAGVWAQTADAGSSPGRLVVVFLRGAYDGLSALVPYADHHYYTLRPHIAIPAPGSATDCVLPLDGTFGLHPALAPLLPFWQQGVLAAIPCAGSPDPTRSHFEAQHHWETGIPGKSSAAPGWLNTLASQRQVGAIGVGESNPLILAGPHAVQRVPNGQAATRQGALGNDRTRDAVMQLYGGEDAISQAFRAGARSRVETAQMLQAAPSDSMQEMVAADNGAGSTKGLPQDAQNLSTLMRQNPRLQIGFLSAGGWDTHANQGAATGPLANNFANLAKALVVLRKEFSRPRDIVLVVSEFGRTSAENGTRGTDHGHGNTLWLLGSKVQGGRWHGRWDGLAPQKLNQGRDLPVHHDFRSVLAQVIGGTYGLSGAALSRLFPGYPHDTALDALMRA